MGTERRTADQLQLFHKDALQLATPSVLSGELYNVLESEKHPVVDLVLNAFLIKRL
ncbi:MAG: hypothetical protein F6K42_00265 [Leptolyngbya sp. SIO1D8]|nr:hypothetical protein [Leptolyngbya sp. SIO1D8]